MGELIGKPGLRATAALAVTLAAGAIGAATASAQQPAICDQYDGLTQCVADEGGSGEAGGGTQTGSDSGAGFAVPGAAGDAAAGGAAGSVVAAGGELPFTGYPLTPLIWLLLALLAAGLAVRAYLAVRDRMRSSRAA